jgi:FkbM family methyltransferase
MIDLFLPIKKFKHLVVLPLLGKLFELKGCRYHADGCTFEIPKAFTTPLVGSRFLLHTYESREIRMVRQLIRAGDSVLELGGCLGVVSCVTNRKLGASSRHLVAEANPQCIGPLTRNRDLNGMSFQVENCAVQGGTPGSFTSDASNITGGRVQVNAAAASPITVKSIDQLHREHGPFNVLICDIEGCELGVFEESAEALRSYRLVIVEFHDFMIGVDGVEHCREILRQAGLTLVATDCGVEAWERNGVPRTPPSAIVRKARLFYEVVISS